MMFYSTTTEGGCAASDRFAKTGRDDTRITADQAAVFLFVAAGLWLTATFVMAGFGAEIGQILAAAG